MICYWLPVEIAYNAKFASTTWWQALEIFTDTIFIMDILINLNTSIYDEDGNEVFDYLEIAKQYLQEIQFWIDLLSIIPLGVSLSILMIMIVVKSVCLSMQVFEGE